ncbi:MAG: hypothetical protein IJL62_03445 [Clostridia bacterium]|nr:hypothetical protein [Clostridia bacterium]
MISMKDAIAAALGDFVEQHTGIRPHPKPSKRAHLASSDFLRGDADETAKLLSAHAGECTLFGAPLIRKIEAENGWLLFFFTADAIDAYAKTLPAPGEPDDSYFARRLWITVRHADAETPDDPVLLDGFYAVLFSAPNGERRFLSAPRHLDGTARVALEQRMKRMANVLLWERRNPL